MQTPGPSRRNGLASPAMPRARVLRGKPRVRGGIWWLAALAFFASLLAVAPSAAEPGTPPATAPESGTEAEYIFAIIPQFEQRKLFTIWKPIVDELQKRTGARLTLVAPLSIQEFDYNMNRGTYDFGYVNPYQFISVGAAQGYVPLVRDETQLRAVLVVRKDGPIQKPEELDGKTLAIPSPNSVGASLLIQKDLLEVYRTRVQLLNAKSHSSVYLHVVNGLAEAGGGVEKTLQEQPAPIREALRVLHTSVPYPGHPISAHPRVPEELRNKMRDAVLAMAATPEGAAQLAKIPMPHPIPANLAEYTVMSQWGLEPFVEKGGY